jgi:hypothetical protein
MKSFVYMYIFIYTTTIYFQEYVGKTLTLLKIAKNTERSALMFQNIFQTSETSHR